MPWQMSHAAYTELENAELQTDVMRFMAILAFCLVAIFAIVQSIPATPAPAADRALAAAPPAVAAPTPEPVVQPVIDQAPEPAPLPSPPIVVQRAQPVVTKQAERPVQLHRSQTRAPQPRSQRSPREATAPVEASARAVAAAQLPQAPSPAPVQEGLSLRFESDAVLRSLVVRGLVSLYAIDGSTYYRMDVAGSDVRFSPAAAPARYHEMIAGTVPGEVRRNFDASASQVTWGVTLPASTSQQLARFVRTNYSGSLVITADARLALSPGGGA